MIRADHARVIAMFHRYRRGTSTRTKQALAQSMCLALEVHAQLEEEIFYPAMASVDVSLVGKLIPQHDAMRAHIARLRSVAAGTAEHDATVMELMREVMHHMADEETVLLPQAERVLDGRLGELGARMMKRRLRLMAPQAGAIARHRPYAMPKGGLVAAAGALAAGAFLFAHLRRRA